MKTSILLLATLGLSFASVSAQTVPEFLNYQGTVTDSAGLGLGDAAPVNRKVLFRVYDAATAGALVWTEEQTVTISKGEFSVLLGQGIQFGSEPHDSLLEVFGEGATDRYVAITVDNGDGTLNGSDFAIAPRQRITSTAYSFRAGTADSIASGSSLKLNSADSGLGYFDSSRLFGGISVDGPVLYGAGGGALGVDNGAGTQTAALRWDSGGDVGIGVTAPLAGQKLHVAGSSYFDGSVKIVSPSIATALTIQSPAAGGYGLRHTNGASFLETWVSPGQANLQSTGSLNILAASTLSLFTNNSPRLTVNSTGNVGIGTTAPVYKLDVNGDIRGSFVVRPGGTYQNGSIYSDSNYGMLFRSAQTNPALATFSFANASDVKLITMLNNGNVGIGTTNPTQKLNVVGGYALLNGLRISGLDTANTIFQATGDMAINTQSSSQRVNIGSNISGTVLTVKDGNVGIGTTSPSRGKLEIVGNGTANSAIINNSYGVFNSLSTNYNVSNSQFAPASLYCSSFTVATGYYANSDERIKDIIGVSDGIDDLSTLMAIEVIDYTLKDKVSKGTAEYKKVIAQQVESVYPQAVIQTTDIIPDIYVKADAKGAWVQLETDLKVGERVRLINENDDNVYEVLEVETDRFRTDLVTEGEWVFVFGREVDDFRNVDYEALSMLNVSATQQLARQVAPNSSELASLKQENLQLKTRLAALEAKDAVRDARLAAIEQLLSTK
jgi:hypothetical protein